MKISRREMLKLMGTTGIGALLASCAPTAPAAPAASSATDEESPAESEQAAAEVVDEGPSDDMTELTIWFHWGGGAGERAQAMVDTYNGDAGAADQIHLTIETTSPNEYRQKMTAARLAGTAPDLYHTSITIMELVTNEVALELPDEDQTYVQNNYVDAAIDRMIFQGKVWGYPTEHQAAGLIYRRSFLEEAGISEYNKYIFPILLI